MFSKDPDFLAKTMGIHTNCKRFALRVWHAANLPIPTDFVDLHVKWLKEYWFDDQGRPITGAEEKELIDNWQLVYESEAQEIFTVI